MATTNTPTRPAKDIKTGHQNKQDSTYEFPPEPQRLKAEEIDAILRTLVLPQYSANPLNVFVGDEEAITLARHGHLRSLTLDGDWSPLSGFTSDWWLGGQTPTNMPLDTLFQEGGELVFVADEGGNNVHRLTAPSRLSGTSASTTDITLSAGTPPGQVVILSAGDNLNLPEFTRTNPGWFCWVQALGSGSSASDGDIQDFRASGGPTYDFDPGEGQLIIRGDSPDNLWETLIPKPA